MDNLINIKVAYANTEQFIEIPLQVVKGCTIEQALLASGILSQFPEIDLPQIHKIGIFGELKTMDWPVEAGDRIEIYRPLIKSPVELRKAKALESRLATLQARELEKQKK